MIKDQIKQYIYGDLYIIDIYTDNKVGTYVGNYYWQDYKLEYLIDAIKKLYED